MAVGSGLVNHVAISTDGLNWTEKGLITTLDATCVSTNGSTVIMGSSTQLFYSTNQGVNWTSLSSIFNTGITKLSFINHRFIAIGESANTIAYSFSVENWYYENNHSLFSGNSPTCIHKFYNADENQFVVNDNLIVTSEYRQKGFVNITIKK